MPRKSDKIPINNPKLDRRIKLTIEDKAKLKRIREEQGLSYNKLAKMFNVSKKTAINVCNPDRYERQLNDRKDRKVHLKYYDREKNSESMKEHRDYKKKLYKAGLI